MSDTAVRARLITTWVPREAGPTLIHQGQIVSSTPSEYGAPRAPEIPPPVTTFSLYPNKIKMYRPTNRGAEVILHKHMLQFCHIFEP